MKFENRRLDDIIKGVSIVRGRKFTRTKTGYYSRLYVIERDRERKLRINGQ